MGNFASNDTITDTSALNELIVFANIYNTEVGQNAKKIKDICNKMEADKTLVGGDGDAIRECFHQVGLTADKCADTAHTVATRLNESLDKAITSITKESAAAASIREDASKHKKKQGKK